MRHIATKGEVVKILDFDAGNEESSVEARAEKARVYKEFDDCPTTGNLIEILRFTHFSRVFKFNKTASNPCDTSENEKEAENGSVTRVAVPFF